MSFCFRTFPEYWNPEHQISAPAETETRSGEAINFGLLVEWCLAPDVSEHGSLEKASPYPDHAFGFSGR
eukprot:13497040-Alexandrium_andersonii.AAC.1